MHDASDHINYVRLALITRPPDGVLLAPLAARRLRASAPRLLN